MSAATMDSAQAGVYRLVTWIGGYDEAKVTRTTAEILDRVDGAARAFGELSQSRQLTSEERTSLEAIAEGPRCYRKHVATAVDLATVDVNIGLSALQTADTSYLELKATSTR